MRLPAQGHLVISGDLHDHIVHLEKIRQLADLGSSPNRHVLLQELIHGPTLTHGCDVSYRMLGKVAQDILAHPVRFMSCSAITNWLSRLEVA